MKYENNGLTRTIRDVIRMAGILAFGAWKDRYKQPKFMENGAEESFYQRLLRRIDQGELNEAENELLEAFDGSWDTAVFQDDREALELALSVYGYMNEKEDDFLEEHQFSREEILLGIKNLLADHGIETDAALDAMLGDW